MDEMNVDLRTARRRFSLVGFAFSALIAVALLAQVGLLLAEKLIWGDAEPAGGASWWMWLQTFLPMYLLAFPACMLLFKVGIPASPIPRRSLTLKEFLTLIPICFCLMYGGNLVGTVLSMLLSGGQAVNTVQEYAMDQSFLKVLMMAILAPLLEELICRKLLIDRIGCYGEKLTVLLSGLIFGLLHQNLFQFFYAFALGSVFGFVYLRTGKLRYTVILHAIVNFLGAVVAPAVLSLVDMEAIEKLSTGEATVEQLLSILPGYLILMTYSGILMGLSVFGVVLLILKLRRLTWNPTAAQLPRKQGLKAAFLNVGMILYIVICLIMTVLALF